MRNSLRKRLKKIMEDHDIIVLKIFYDPYLHTDFDYAKILISINNEYLKLKYDINIIQIVFNPYNLMDSLSDQNFTINKKVYKMDFADYHTLVSPIFNKLIKLNVKTFKINFEVGYVSYVRNDRHI